MEPQHSVAAQQAPELADGASVHPSEAQDQRHAAAVQTENGRQLAFGWGDPSPCGGAHDLLVSAWSVLPLFTILGGRRQAWASCKGTWWTP